MTKKSVFPNLKILNGAWAFAAAVTMPVVAAADVYVASSIRPLHSLVEMVLGQEGESILLVDGATSPHDFILRPSDRLHLAKADLVFVIDEKFAPQLSKAVDDPKRLVQMSKSGGITMIERRTSAAFGHDHDDHGHDEHKHDDHGHDDHGHDDHDEHAHDDHGHEGHDDHGHDDHDEHAHDDHGHEGHDDHGHDDHDEHKHDDHGHDDHGHSHDFGKYDLHLWLDAQNAIAMVDLIEYRLASRYPDHRTAFAANAEQARQQLQSLDAVIKAETAALKDIGLIVYHDAYTYFENAYGMSVKTTVLDHHDASSGVNRIQMIRHLIDDGDITCLAREPQFSAKILQTIDPGNKLIRIEMDPIGTKYPQGAGHYMEMMQGLVSALQQCRP